MGSAYIPTQTIVDRYVGTTSSSNPYVAIVIDGVAYPNGYRVDYSGGFRIFSGTYDPLNGNIYIRCQAFAYGEDLPEYTLSNAQVLVIAIARPPPVGNPTISGFNGSFDDGYYRLIMYYTTVANAIRYNIYIRPQSDTTNTWTYLTYAIASSLNNNNYTGVTESVVVYDEPFSVYGYESSWKWKIVAVGEDDEEYGVGYYG